MKTLSVSCAVIIVWIFSCLNGSEAVGKEFGGWAKVPPMGWNSWDCYGPTVVEDEVKANADYMAKYLKDYGWEYVVVDIRWYVSNDKAHGYNETDPCYVMDEYGRFRPSEKRFASAAGGKGFKPLADYVHSNGLKFGIHIMRGIPKLAVRKNTAILGSKARARDVYSKERLCTWLGDMYTVDWRKDGAQAYYDSLFELYASWDVDFVKADNLSFPYHKEEVEMIRKAIDKCGRKMVLSTSSGETAIKFAEHVKSHANMWRIVGDFWDKWPQLKEHFEVCNRWAAHIGKGHWPDCDMLPLGRIGIRAEVGEDRMTAFTKDEQITLMTLFAMARSPLMFGGDLVSNDEFTLSLLTNREVIAVNQHSVNNRQLSRRGDLIAWTAEDPETGDKYLAVFNASDRKEIVEGKAIWKSEVISHESADKGTDVKVNIAGAKKLYLAAVDPGDSSYKHLGCWVEPRLVGDKGTVGLTDLKWRSASGRKKKPAMNKSFAGGKLTINETEYENGIGVRANSIIEYDLPEGYEWFEARAGLDKAAITQMENGANIRFLVFTQEPGENAEPAEEAAIPVKFAELGLEGKCVVKDLWAGRSVGEFEDEFAPVIKRHGAGLYRVSKKQ